MGQLREIACKGKEALTEERAREVAANMRRRRQTKGAVSAYKCRCCGAWHVGSTPPSKRKVPRETLKALKARDQEHLEQQEKRWITGSRA